MVTQQNGANMPGPEHAEQGGPFHRHAAQMAKFIWHHVRSLLGGPKRDDTFEKHTETMKSFQRSHTADLKPGPSRPPAPTPYAALRLDETASPGPTAGEWLVLLPVSEVSPHQFSLN